LLRLAASDLSHPLGSAGETERGQCRLTRLLGGACRLEDASDAPKPVEGHKVARVSRVEDLVACSQASSGRLGQLTQEREEIRAALWVLIELRFLNREDQIWPDRGRWRFNS